MAEIPVLEAAPGQDEGGKKFPWLMTTFVMLVLLALVAGATWYFFAGPAAQKGHVETKAVAQPPIYIALDPPFVVNFEAEQLVRFLQVTVQVMTRDAATADLVRANDPVVRNDLLLLLGNQHYETISTREGKEKLRAQALATVRKVVANAGGKADKIEAVYFTSFVMQ
ncbi:MAG TPA: flagellar basal body-associated FliL family protein [Steroidobacteraceae bacterium]|nr:flagellar basal body-associated FliL family protein [Steroidobacteraceae bacterium]